MADERYWSNDQPPRRVVRETLVRSSQQVWARTLAEIDNPLQRLMYLSALRDSQTAKYWHDGLVSRFGETEAQNTILESHRAAFSDWLEHGIATQKGLLLECLQKMDEPVHLVVTRWLSVAYYRAWMPVGTPDHQQQLYLTDFETLLQIVSRETTEGE